MTDPLSQQRCIPCEGGVAPLTPAEAETLLQQVHHWKLSENHDSIHRTFDFSGFYKTMGFINMVAWIAQQQGHHPDVQFGYKQCTITYSTHAINGLSQNDFICASLINDALAEA